MDLSHMLAGLIEIVWLSLILTGDNAVLLAMNTRALPAEQRRIGVNAGTLLFIALRIVFAYTLLAVAGAPGVALAGAAVLTFGALALARREAKEATPAPPPPPRRNLAAALLACAAADAPVALLNMLAVLAASRGDRTLMLFGLALSIPLLALGSAQFITILRKTPLLWAGAGLLGWVAGQLAASDALVRASAMPPEIMRDFAPPLGAVLAILLAYGYLRGRKIKRVIEE